MPRKTERVRGGGVRGREREGGVKKERETERERVREVSIFDPAVSCITSCRFGLLSGENGGYFGTLSGNLLIFSGSKISPLLTAAQTFSLSLYKCLSKPYGAVI